MVCFNFVTHACLWGKAVAFLDTTAITVGRESGDEMVDALGSQHLVEQETSTVLGGRS